MPLSTNGASFTRFFMDGCVARDDIQRSFFLFYVKKGEKGTNYYVELFYYIVSLI